MEGGGSVWVLRRVVLTMAGLCGKGKVGKPDAVLANLG